ncbi:hypothetical protein OQA88_9699 [Cercophora sp. LCS_1]
MTEKLLHDTHSHLRQTLNPGSNPDVELAITGFLNSVSTLARTSETQQTKGSKKQVKFTDDVDTKMHEISQSLLHYDMSETTGRKLRLKKKRGVDYDMDNSPFRSSISLRSYGDLKDGDLSRELQLVFYDEPHPLSWIAATFGIQEFVLQTFANKLETLADPAIETELSFTFLIHILGAQARELCRKIVRRALVDVSKAIRGNRQFMMALNRRRTSLERQGWKEPRMGARITQDHYRELRDELREKLSPFQLPLKRLSTMITELDRRLRLLKPQKKQLLVINDDIIAAIEDFLPVAIDGIHESIEKLSSDIAWLEEPPPFYIGIDTVDDVRNAKKLATCHFEEFVEIADAYNDCGELMRELSMRWNGIRAGMRNPAAVLE